MAVIINEMESTVEPAPGGAATGSGGNAASQQLDDEAFRLRYASVIRDIIRDELDRHLRTAAD